jgi:hypothetical protein
MSACNGDYHTLWSWQNNVITANVKVSNGTVYCLDGTLSLVYLESNGCYANGQNVTDTHLEWDIGQ